MICPAHLSDVKFKNCTDLLLITNENKLHYVHITDFNRFMFSKTKNKNEKYFSRYCLQCFSSEKVLQEHKNVCLKINGKQIVKLRNGSIKLKNYVKQLAVPFKIFAHFEPALKGFQRNDNNNASYTKK